MVCWGGHSIGREEYEYTKLVGYELGLRGLPHTLFLAADGSVEFNVAIRTITLFPDGEAVYNVGGGVVFDSTAEEEYAECLLKARYATGRPPASP